MTTPREYVQRIEAERDAALAEVARLQEALASISRARSLHDVHLILNTEVADRVHSGESVQGCTGHHDCSAHLHIHGCYADFGTCGTPEEHGG